MCECCRLTFRRHQNFQKDAILRQMKDYKRAKKDSEERVAELQKKCQHHDDHLRTIDAWFAQLLDEVRILATQMLPTPPPSAGSTTGMPPTTPISVT